MLRLALRNIFRQWLRTGLTLLAIATGVTGLILSGGFVEDVYLQLGEATIHSQLGHLQVANAGYRRAGRDADTGRGCGTRKRNAARHVGEDHRGTPDARNR